MGLYSVILESVPMPPTVQMIHKKLKSSSSSPPPQRGATETGLVIQTASVSQVVSPLSGAGLPDRAAFGHALCGRAWKIKASRMTLKWITTGMNKPLRKFSCSKRVFSWTSQYIHWQGTQSGNHFLLLSRPYISRLLKTNTKVQSTTKARHNPSSL